MHVHTWSAHAPRTSSCDQHDARHSFLRSGFPLYSLSLRRSPRLTLLQEGVEQCTEQRLLRSLPSLVSA